MLARFRSRLTYSNVVATLALFVALGGTSYAVGEITSRDIRNRSVKGGDIRLNTITGKEINESKMGQVPNARQAQTSLTAANATVSDLATRANSAGSADLAAVASDAQNLAGQGVGAFERSSRVQFGRAPADPASSGAEQAIIAWPEMGVELRNATNQGGCGGGELRMAIRNTKSSGPNALFFEEGVAGAIMNAAPGVTANQCSNATSAEMRGMLTDSTGRSLYITCKNVGGEVRCLGVRSEA